MQPLSQQLASYLDRHDPERKNYLFSQLCTNWQQAVGAELAKMVRPVGRKKTTLILAAQDSVILQEASMQQDIILDRIHHFCGCELFDKIRVELLKGRLPLDSKLVPGPDMSRLPPRPSELGGLLNHLPSNSAITRCYEKYVRLFENTQE